MKKIELLAPCGNIDALYAAVSAKADAVYLSGVSFGARAFANNFTNEQLKTAVEYAHLHNVLVYVTINTIIKENEFDELTKTINDRCQAEASARDALISHLMTTIEQTKTDLSDKLKVEAEARSEADQNLEQQLIALFAILTHQRT